MHQDHADLARLDGRIASRDPPSEIVQLGYHLDAGESAARDHEGEQLLAQPRIVVLDGRFLDGADDAVAYLQGVLQVLEGKRVLGEPAQTAEIGDVAERQDEMIERQHVRVRLEAGRRRHRTRGKVDPLHLADVELGARQEMLQGADQIGEPDGSADDFREHGLEDEVVLLGDEDDLDVVASAESFLQRCRGEHAAESAAEDDDAFPVGRWRSLRAEDARNARVVNDLRAAAWQGQECREQHPERRSDEVEEERGEVAVEQRGGERPGRVHARSRKRRLDEDVDRQERSGDETGISREA